MAPGIPIVKGVRSDTLAQSHFPLFLATLQSPMHQELADTRHTVSPHG
jgi:hypothetical protein